MINLSQFQQIHFVTGRLAEPALRRELAPLSQRYGFAYTVDVMPITVAALLTVPWVAKRINVPEDSQAVVLPGYCLGPLSELQSAVSCPVIRGPKDLKQLPIYFGGVQEPPELEDYDIQIICEINHAPQMSLHKIAQTARLLVAQGADIIDIGCEPGYQWNQVADAVRCVCDLGIPVSIDSMNTKEITQAVQAGAQLVLSVNRQTAVAAKDWDAEVVAIPDQPDDWKSLVETVETLKDNRCRFRIDPILEPIGCGFADSLQRYHQTRQTWPDAEIMMGVGNLTELTDVDSAGINLLLLGICQELGIRSVLTTQVINWARSSVQELDIARRMVFHSIKNQTPPKRISSQLIQLRDDRLQNNDMQSMQELALSITDPNYRIFNVGNRLVCLGNGQLWSAEDPFDLFQQLQQSGAENLDPSHAFYLGYEMCKAKIAGQLGKNYDQDQSLNWGHLTIPEPDRHIQRTKRSGRKKD